MKSRLINVLVFAVGAAIGSAVTWKIVKTKYDRIIQEEIDSVKEAFANGFPEFPEEAEEQEEDVSEDRHKNVTTRQINWSELEDLDEEEDDEDDEDDEAASDYALNEYKRLTRQYTNEKGGTEDMAKDPYVISPYDFGELDNWHSIELTYYADDILEDGEYNIVNDRDELIGPKALLTFGEYEDDSVFVRNERLRTDFQILKDPRTYDEARSIGPGGVRDE